MHLVRPHIRAGGKTFLRRLSAPEKLRTHLLPELRVSDAEGIEAGRMGKASIEQTKGVKTVARNGNRMRWGDHKSVAADSHPIDYSNTDVDELLELIYTLRESEGVTTLEELKNKCKENPHIDKVVEKAQAAGLVLMSDDNIFFSKSGKAEAEKLIRAHRLAERLLTDVLLVHKEQEMEKQACAMEHVLNPAVVDNICTILGHPRTCPHGRDIPLGPCCGEGKREAQQAVLTLDQLQSGESGKILYVETKDHSRLDKLTTFGMLPGTIVRVHQRQPSLVILLGQTQLALDREIARNVHLVKM
jgi:DtxR family Mn-dependent transcriptional regulator